MQTEQIELTNPVDESVGGMGGHILRRTIHIAMIFIPFLYFEYGGTISSGINLELNQLVSILLLVIVLGEAIRLKIGFTVFGQREYEAHQVSALAWGGLSICLVLLITPQQEYAYPLIISLALGDPFMGELRRKQVSQTLLITLTLFLLGAIWLASWHLFSTPMWFAPIMAPVCMVSEWPRYSIIDDNATMLLIPLCTVVTLHSFV